ncbi:MAG: hypothetical protein HEQ35_21190 [Gloeotrichia echinulata IR180]|jgi:hypothetical protein|nr:hypothetical protein [Gloeotrichia echinulata DEX184]
MFRTLTLILVWLLIGTVAFSLFQRFYPKGTFLGRVVLGLLSLVLVLAFVNPNEPAVASLWRLVSFPLKPLGASTLMLIFAAQKIEKGGIKEPGGYLLGWSLAILLLSSTPAIAYFLVRSPVGALPPSSSLVALAPANTSANISDVQGNAILPQVNTAEITLAFNTPTIKVPAYLLQNPQEIRTRGLRIEDFVPSAETLALTTNVWESYLNQIYGFLRGR